MAFHTIIAAVDGSEPGMRAAEAAADMARRFGASLVLLHVAKMEPSAAVLEGLAAYEQAEHVRMVPADLAQGESERILQAAASRARAKGPVKTETVADSGDPVQRILDTAQERGADLIVLGRRGLGTLAGLLLGSVSHKVIQLSKLPCLTVV